MKHRKLLLIVCLALALTMTLGSTLAYLTDVDSETNTFTMGKVDIEIKEENFHQNDPLWPGEKSDKDAYIENKGQTDAWVWMTVTIPATIKDYVFPVWANDTIADSVTYDEDENGNKVYTYLVQEMLTDGQTTEKILDAVEMSNRVDVQNDQMVVIENGQPVVIEGVDLAKLDVTVKAYAVQATGIESVEDAYKAYHDQWDNGDGGSSGEDEQPGEDDEPTVTWTEVGSLEQLQNAVAAGGNVKLTEGISLPAGTIITIPADKEVTLNLNGQTLSAEGMNDQTICNYGMLTITGGTVHSVRGSYPLYNKGVMIIDGVNVVATRTLSAGNMTSTAQTTIKGNSTIKGFNNMGTLVIEDGNFEQYESATSIYTVMNNGGNTTVEGGTFKNLFRNISNGTATITGGTFYVNPTQYVDTSAYNVTNTDGTWTVTAK